MWSMALIAAAALVAPGTAGHPDEAGVRAALQHYLDGQAGVGPEAFKKAFYPEARLQVVRNGKLTLIESPQWIANMKPVPAGTKPEARPGNRVEWVDIAGNAAVAKVHLDTPRGSFSDYMTLMKVEGAWRISNKAFHFFPNATAAPAAK